MRGSNVGVVIRLEFSDYVSGRWGRYFVEFWRLLQCLSQEEERPWAILLATTS